MLEQILIRLVEGNVPIAYCDRTLLDKGVEMRITYVTFFIREHDFKPELGWAAFQLLSDDSTQMGFLLPVYMLFQR